MKIEKLTENKIRIIINQDDLKDSSLDLHTIMTKTIEAQGLFLEILDKAKKECGFDTDGYKLLIEAFSSQDEVIVFTITKFELKAEDKPAVSSFPKRLKVKRKFNVLPIYDFSIYRFEDFEQFCSFCASLRMYNQLSTNGLMCSSLYSYNNKFFLVLSRIQLEYKSFILLCSLLSEFAIFCTNVNNFENRLKEYGKCLMRKNAISTTLKFFN